MTNVLKALGVFLASKSLFDVGVQGFSNLASSVRHFHCHPSPLIGSPRSLDIPSNAPFSPSSALCLSQKSSEQQQVEEKVESLSDVDARVLQEMLAESKLDLETEDDIRKLLERGTVKSTVNRKEQERAEAKQRREDSPFDSTILQTFTDTKLWKKLSAQTSDLLESAKIWVSNKVEADLQVAAALGLFAWERAVRDVSRALPAAGSAAQNVIKKEMPLSLTNTSSYREEPIKKKTSIRDDLNRPEDEIKEVTRAVFSILKGETAAGAANARALRTAARAGTINTAERQKQAFRQRRRLERRDRDLSRIAGSVVDATYELQRELKAETSTAGYKTKPIRNAIAAGTVGMLSAVQETARIAAAKRKETLALKQAAVNRTVVYSQLLEERLAIQQRLVACIEEPQITWGASEFTRNLSEEKLRQVATMLMLLRDNILATSQPSIAEGEKVTVEQANTLLQVLRTDLQAVRDLKSNVEADISFGMAEALYKAIIGISGDESGENSLLVRLEEIQATLQPPAVPDATDIEPRAEDVFFANAVIGDSEETIPASWAATVPTDDPDDDASFDVPEPITKRASFIDALVVDIVPEVVMQSDALTDALAGDTEVVMDDDFNELGVPKYRSFVAEVVSDDDVETAFGGAKAVKNLSEEEIEEESVQEPNLAVKAVLRTLDIVFFVLEKSFTVVLPATIRYSVTAARRYDEVQRSGQGHEGWELLHRSADAKGRY
eukprot:scaffold2753_cov154-Amphora_coffeaeformis.AAC.1